MPIEVLLPTGTHVGIVETAHAPPWHAIAACAGQSALNFVMAAVSGASLSAVIGIGQQRPCTVCEHWRLLQNGQQVRASCESLSMLASCEAQSGLGGGATTSDAGPASFGGTLESGVPPSPPEAT